MIAVTLNDPDDWNDHKELLTLGLDSLKVFSPDEKARCGMINVVGGAAFAVPYYFGERTFGVYKAGEEEITCTVNVPGFLYAPVRIGDEIGTAEYRLGSRVIASVPVYAVGESEAKSEKPSARNFRAILIGILKNFI